MPPPPPPPMDVPSAPAPNQGPPTYSEAEAEKSVPKINPALAEALVETKTPKSSHAVTRRKRTLRPTSSKNYADSSDEGTTNHPSSDDDFKEIST